jgi:hypothetical protein
MAHLHAIKERWTHLKLVKKIPKTDIELSNKLINNGWKKIREPKGLSQAILSSMPFMIVNGFISAIILLQFYNPFTKLVSGSSLSFIIKIDFALIFYLAVLFVFSLFHEAFHVVFVPNFLHSIKTYWGITPYGGFVSTTEEVTKSRYILISIAPFVFLAILAPIILGLFGLLNNFISFAIFINALGASVDFLNATLVIFQVPSNSRIINNGFETFYK